MTGLSSHPHPLITSYSPPFPPPLFCFHSLTPYIFFSLVSLSRRCPGTIAETIYNRKPVTKLTGEREREETAKETDEFSCCVVKGSQ